jgi:hypothetical protein
VARHGIDKAGTGVAFAVLQSIGKYANKADVMSYSDTCQPSAAHWAAQLVAEDVSTGNHLRVAHRLGGIIANDDRILSAIERAIHKSGDLSRDSASVYVVEVVSAVLAGGLGE